MLHLAKPLTQPATGALLVTDDERATIAAKPDGHARDRVRYGACSARLTHPREIAEIESTVRDERYLEAA
jgi:hypothetical protein